MLNYTEKVMDHFRNPRNVGYIKDPDGIGEVGSAACGDVLRLMFKLDEKGRIADVKFQTYGCASAIASASVLTEIIKGKTLEEAENITNLDIVEYLGGLPEHKIHCSVMGREALEAAIENFRKGTTGRKTLEGKVICICFGVTEEKIKRAIRENKLTTVEQVTQLIKAGSACGGCKEEIAEIIASLAEEVKATPEVTPRKGMTNLQKIQLIKEIIEYEIKPELLQHGGNIELIDVNGNQVIVSLQGACKECHVSNITIKNLVEPKLKERVSAELEVVEER
ncbi:MAG TPA: Fe-S cluster assembly protein NifU [archaeon]|nr:Fe-S cluster assembly protein NifU [archaeon]